MNTAVDASTQHSNTLTARGRYLVLIATFLGWMFAGMEMSLMVPATRPAIQDFLSAKQTALSGGASEIGHFEVQADQWLSWLIAAFLLGAALGGVVFGWLADRAGRVKAMGFSILCYSTITALSYFVTSPEQLLALRFIACLGIGGMWPSGVALVTEAWPRVSRPALAGLIGAAANVGFLILGLIMLYHPITRDSWRWVFLLGGTPALLGAFVLVLVPESPRWLMEKHRFDTTRSNDEPNVLFSLGSAGDPPASFGDSPNETKASSRANREANLASRSTAIPSGGSPDGTGESPVLPALNTYSGGEGVQRTGEGAPFTERNAPPSQVSSPVADVFRPPLLRWTLLGIALGTIPLLGGWASGQRLVPWAGQVGELQGMPGLKAATQTLQSLGAVIGSLMGGWLASRLGRRRSYFLISLGSLALSGYIFLTLTPARAEFLWATFALGLVSTSFFGWLPYFLPELFPTRVRATGAGVTYNFGRILSAVALLSSTALSELFQGDIAKMGITTSLVYALGLLLVWFIPPDAHLNQTEPSEPS